MSTQNPKSRGSDRREFLQTSAGIVGASALGYTVPAIAKSAHTPERGSNPKKLVIVFLRGGADGMQLVAPTGDNTYYSLRPSIGVLQPGSNGGVDEGLPLDPGSAATSPFSFHPALTRLHTRYLQANSNLAVIGAAGYDPASRSHFTSQDILETGAVGQQINTGWVNRFIETTNNSSLVRALALRSSLPLSMRGPADGAFGMESTNGALAPPHVSRHVRPAVDRHPAATPAGMAVYSSMRDAFSVLDLLDSVTPTAPQNGAAYPPNSTFARRLREVAQLIRADIGIDVFQVELGGWDHHSSLTPRMNTLATAFDGAIGEFLIDMGTDMDDVCLLTLTDFGRTAAENRSSGTDHGIAQAMFVAGGAVRGGDPGGGQQVYGWQGLQNLQSGRFLAAVVDYRDVITEVLVEHMGMSIADIPHVFPGLSYSPPGII